VTRILLLAAESASAPDQYVQSGNQPDGAGIDTGEVIDQPLGYQTELRTVPSHAS